MCWHMQVVEALNAAERQPKPPLTEMFTDVYDSLPWHLKEQEAEVIDFVRRHPTVVPSDVPIQ
jgi:2-oxoisovalerate dehydrogenase E1 component alpha subunit